MTAQEHSKSGDSHSGSSDQLLSLTDILYVVRKRWLIGAICAVVFSALFVFAIVSKADLYEATASMTVELSTANVMDINEVVDTKVTHVNLLNTFMNTHVERVKSRGIADAVVAKLSEGEYVELVEGYVGPLSERPPEKRRPDAAGLLMNNALIVERGDEDDSQVILITIRHASPRIAQLVANAYVEAFIEYKAGLRSESTSEAVVFLKQQVDEMQAQLSKAEDELQVFRQDRNLISVQQDEGIIVERLRNLNAAVTETRLRLLESKTTVDQIETAGNDFERLVEIPFIGTRNEITGVYAQLNELKRERSVLDETYLRRHPKIVENDASLKAVQAVLERSIEQAKNQAEIEYKGLTTELSGLESKLAAAEKEVLDTERALVEYRRMERDVQSQRELLDSVTKRYNETSIAQRMNLNNISLLDMARLPMRPNAPSTVQVAAAAILIAGIFFFGVPLGIELLDQRLTSFADVEVYAGKTLLGDLRLFPKKSFQEVAQAVLRRDTDFIDQMRNIYSGLRMHSKVTEHKMAYVVTSAVAGEGKSSVAANLAALIARHDFSVLLVDCDLRRPAQHNFFGHENDHGLIPWFESIGGQSVPSDPFDDKQLGIVQLGENLYLLRSGGSTSDPTEIFGDRKTVELFQNLKEQFDHIVFDTPPIGLFPDAALVGDFADETVFVAKQFSVNRQKMRYSIGLMDRSEAPVVGVVFNGVKDVTAAVGFGNKASQYYGHGYEKDLRKYREYYRREA